MSLLKEYEVWREQPVHACSSAIGSWDAALTVLDTVASSVHRRRMQPLARLQTSCFETQPNQFFYALLSRQTSVCLCARVCVCPTGNRGLICVRIHASKNEQRPTTIIFLKDGPVSQSEVILLMNGKTINMENHKERVYVPRISTL